MERTLLALLLLMSSLPLGLQAQNLQRVEPPFWWTGMANENLQLLVYGPNIATQKASITYPGVQLMSMQRVANPNYLFLNLQISHEAKAGLVPIVFQQGEQAFAIQYELKARESQDNRIQGVTSEDFIYLLMPDRFANGNPDNDAIEGMEQAESSRTQQYGRHGGDLQGVADHLDYFQELGVTALWLNPILENNQPEESYHGYAMTDHYRVDPRFGNNQDFKALVDACHQRGIKIVWDVVHNHVGNYHWFIKDLPDPSWVNQWDEYTPTSYRAPTLMDPYASEKDKELMQNGWFDHHMPDLNQKNPLVANYLTQNNIWWIEYAGLDGLRVDTYAYPDQAFMADWAKEVLNEYPQLGMFGETWVHGIPVQAWFTEKNGWKADSYLPATTDFQLYYAINDALSQPFGWTEGLARLYYTLAQDFVYEDPMKKVVFLDNHDLGRFYSMAGEDFGKYQMGITFLLTTRGIPQLYYGTEVLMKNHWDGNNHDKVREEFPGGWEGDKADKFSRTGRTEQEQQAFETVKTLANFRKGSSAIKTGKLMQFVPENGVYVYFRYDEQQTVMVILNQNDSQQEVDFSRFSERLVGFSKAIDVLGAEQVEDLSKLKVSATSATVLLLQK
ncbi:MAG: glycoside hydrolase family 13 protein [Bacteroidota bacterium]